MTTGNHCGYYWMQWKAGWLGRLLAGVPQIVLNRHLVNTSFDSGSLALTAPQFAQGWRSIGPLTYSPLITDIQSIPYEQFAEWLVFSRATELPCWESVVNLCGFSLTDRSYDWTHAKLWGQLERYRPESFLSQGERLIFITRNAQLHDLARACEQV